MRKTLIQIVILPGISILLTILRKMPIPAQNPGPLPFYQILILLFVGGGLFGMIGALILEGTRNIGMWSGLFTDVFILVLAIWLRRQARGTKRRVFNWVVVGTILFFCCDLLRGGKLF